MNCGQNLENDADELRSGLTGRVAVVEFSSTGGLAGCQFSLTQVASLRQGGWIFFLDKSGLAGRLKDGMPGTGGFTGMLGGAQTQVN